MQGNEDAIKSLGRQIMQRTLRRIKGMRVNVSSAQGSENRVPAFERDLAFGGIAAEHHRHLAKLRSQIGSPTICTSHSSETPNFSCTAP